LADLRPLCLACLRPCLAADYSAYQAHGVVVEPVAGAPVYVFQSLSAWQSLFPKSPIPSDVEALVREMDFECRCGSPARFVWVASEGLTAETFSDLVDRGLKAMLRNDLTPSALCAACCVNRIVHSMETRELSYIEVCPPSGEAAGIVLPMAY